MQTDFCRGLRDGFVLEYSVPASITDMAEFTVDEASSGYWFGGGGGREHSFSFFLFFVPIDRLICGRGSGREL